MGVKEKTKKDWLIILCIILGLISVGCINQQTKVEISNWPNGHRSALSITFDTEIATKDDLTAVTSILKSRDLPATFFVVSGYYQNTPGALEAIRDFEVANMGWNQTEWMLSDLNDNLQNVRIEDSDEWLKEHSFWPLGFRSPYLRHNKYSITILQKSGYLYDSSKIGTMPKDNGILEIPVAINFDPFWNEKSMEYTKLPTYTIFKQTNDNGELFTFTTHPEKTAENLPEFIEFLDHIEDKNVWTASTLEVAEWWKQRQSLEITRNKEKVAVKNTGNQIIKGVTLKISPKREVEGAITIVEENDAIYAVLPDILPEDETVLRLI